MAKKYANRTITIRVFLTAGICRWCRCTDDNACANGCSWVERSQTLCSECVPLDKAMQTIEGRRELAEFLQEYGFLVRPVRHWHPAEPAEPRAKAKAR